MKDYLGRVATTIKDAAKKSSQVVSEVIEHQDTQAAIAWTKQTTAVVADEAVRLGKEVARSELVKDAATGAAIGAAVAIPIPVIGPAAGAVVGAGLGIYKNITKQPDESSSTQPETARLISSSTQIDPYEELIKYNELLQQGIISEDDFKSIKRKLLSDK